MSIIPNGNRLLIYEGRGHKGTIYVSGEVVSTPMLNERTFTVAVKEGSAVVMHEYTYAGGLLGKVYT